MTLKPYLSEEISAGDKFSIFGFASLLALVALIGMFVYSVFDTTLSKAGRQSNKNLTAGLIETNKIVSNVSANPFINEVVQKDPILYGNNSNIPTNNVPTPEQIAQDEVNKMVFDVYMWSPTTMHNFLNKTENPIILDDTQLKQIEELLTTTLQEIKNYRSQWKPVKQIPMPDVNYNLDEVLYSRHWKLGEQVVNKQYRIMAGIYSYYWAPLGGINCDYDCNTLASGFNTADYIGIGWACDQSIPFGTVLYFEELGIYGVCVDRGGMISFDSDKGGFWFDQNIKVPLLPYGTKLTVRVYDLD